MSVKVTIHCSNCEALETLECDVVYIITVKDGKVEAVSHELDYFSRIGLLSESLRLERKAMDKRSGNSQ